MSNETPLTNPNIDKADQSGSQATKSRKPLIAILVISILPLFAAYTMFFTGVGVPTTTKNNGFLISPAININQLNSDDVTQALEAWKTDIKWRILLPMPRGCNQSCQDNFYVTRQVDTRLGEKSVRVDRVAIDLDAGANTYYESVKQAHPDLQVLAVDRKQWTEWIAQTNLQNQPLDDHYYILLNQEGFAMMWYNNRIHGNDLLKDLKHVIKYSIDFQKSK